MTLLAWGRSLARLFRNRPQARRARLAIEPLEDRMVLSIAELPPQAITPFAALPATTGVSTDAGKVYVAASNTDVFNPGEIIQAYNPGTGQTIGTAFPNPGIPVGITSSTGTLATLPDGINLSPVGGTQLQGGDLLSLLPDGRIVAVRPSTGGAELFLNLKGLVSSSRGLGVWNVDNTDIFDVMRGIRANFGGVIIPEAAQTSYNDIAVYQGTNFTDVLVSGVSSLPFVMRARYVNGQFTSAKVLVSSTGTTGGFPSVGSQLAPVAVNSSGVVLTTLPVRSTIPNQNFAVFAPIAFDIGFSEGNGRAPFQPFAFDNTIQKGELSGRLQGAGMTTDSRGNFIVAPTTTQNASQTRSGFFIVDATVSDLYFVPFTGSALTLHQADVAVSTDDQYAFIATNVQTTGANTLVARVPLPTLPSRQLGDLAPYQPDGWSSALVVSTRTGTTTNATAFTTADTVYVDWAVINRGAAAVTGAFHTRLLLDGREVTTWVTNPPLNANTYTFVLDYSLGRLSAGAHTLTLVIDQQGEVGESDETNNTFTRNFTVTAPGAPPAAPPSAPTPVASDTAGDGDDSPLDIANFFHPIRKRGRHRRGGKRRGATLKRA